MSQTTVLTIVGARPQFVKAATVSKALRQHAREVLLHTGQHYDHAMSDAFFDELGIPAPDINLGVGSGSHAAMTGAMLQGIDEHIRRIKPDLVLIYGDTNSTLAGALAAAKIPVPLAHVEAGLRSRRMDMPEEVNRLVADRLAQLLFAPTAEAVQNLAHEGITDGVHQVGDVMYDAFLSFRERAVRESRIVDSLDADGKPYFVATVHRAENTDSLERLRAILGALENAPADVYLPLHPRTRHVLREAGMSVGGRVHVIEPLGYLDLLALGAQARAILTDSGGVQKEAFWAGVPCITLRRETEWVETVEAGWNTLVDADPERIRAAAEAAVSFDRATPRPEVYGDGHAAERIAQIIAAGIPAIPTSIPEARVGLEAAR